MAPGAFLDAVARNSDLRQAEQAELPRSRPLPDAFFRVVALSMAGYHCSPRRVKKVVDKGHSSRAGMKTRHATHRRQQKEWRMVFCRTQTKRERAQMAAIEGRRTTSEGGAATGNKEKIGDGGRRSKGSPDDVLGWVSAMAAQQQVVGPSRLAGSRNSHSHEPVTARRSRSGLAEEAYPGNRKGEKGEENTAEVTCQ